MSFQEDFLKKPYRVHSLLFVLFIIAGFFYAPPMVIFEGLFEIFTGVDILISDYIYTGGFGAALVNVGLTGLLVAGALVHAKHEPVGLTMGTFGLTMGLAFFGKNPINMLPILVGGFLYSKYAQLPNAKCVLRAVLATCLAPAVTLVAYATDLPVAVSVIIGAVIGLLIGFLINPLAIHMAAAHKGYNLYNVGWTAGIIAMGVFSLFTLFGVDYELKENWSYGYTPHLTILLAAVSLYFILCGALTKIEKVPFWDFFKFHKFDLDYFVLFKEKSYIHMGILGIACLLFMLAVGGEYNGPVIGVIISVVGFGAFGKALFSSAPIIAGAMLAAVVSHFLTGMDVTGSGVLVAAFFSTCLAPMAKRFGFGWGVAAGFLHLSFATNIAPFHGGLNLYNNGFAGGLTALILVPIILFLRREEE
ncbi:MAG: DUF1576 domain-containing protein [Defluviitaleaceae bacterium]|nr:DUF1576 domain-containing protein [Defluviitaleaceae bacterium]MCL2262726.1 DUF1576 domain-containing protein [Defluviitaleaceae bacterium]